MRIAQSEIKARSKKQAVGIIKGGHYDIIFYNADYVKVNRCYYEK